MVYVFENAIKEEHIFNEVKHFTNVTTNERPCKPQTNVHKNKERLIKADTAQCAQEALSILYLLALIQKPHTHTHTQNSNKP